LGAKTAEENALQRLYLLVAREVKGVLREQAQREVVGQVETVVDLREILDPAVGRAQPAIGEAGLVPACARARRPIR
jgi:hypothetical protein